MVSDGRELIIDESGLDRLIEVLRSDGRVVFGPTVRDGAIVHGEVSRAADLPVGWTDEQSPGRYRLSATGDGRRFGFSAPSESWKRFVHPPRSVVIRSRRDEGRVSLEEPNSDVQPSAFFGIRSCDLASLRVLDRVLLDADHPDPGYAARRSDVFIVAIACAVPGGTCFCDSMQTGPSPTQGFDLSLVEMVGSAGPEYLTTAGTERGSRVLSSLSGRTPTEDDRSKERAQHDAAVNAMGRRLDPADLPVAAENPRSERWEQIAERCLACGNCTMVCPTCFCTGVEDTTSLDGRLAERTRVWDSCFSLGFTHLDGGSTRTSIASRYRQWLLHKLVTWHDQFDMSGCVGCGRCITWCPVGIDLTAEVAALARAQREHR